MFAKGFGLTEVLLALLLSSFIFTATISCQWFARRSMQVNLEQMVASQLLTDISQSVQFAPGTPVLQVSTDNLQCVGCALPVLQQSRMVQQLMLQPRATTLADLQFCHDATAGRLSLSWRSHVAPERSSVRGCGAGAGRRQIGLAVAR